VRHIVSELQQTKVNSSNVHWRVSAFSLDGSYNLKGKLIKSGATAQVLKQQLDKKLFIPFFGLFNIGPTRPMRISKIYLIKFNVYS
jgi:hypothetical protein